MCHRLMAYSQEFGDLPTRTKDEDGDVAQLNAVVVGLAPSKFNYESLCDAFRLLNSGARLIAVHKSRYFKNGAGDLTLGPGPFVAGLEFAAGVNAHVVGKPEKAFYVSALEALNRDKGTSIDPQETLMIGDDVLIDAIGAQKAGFRGCLVKSGKYRLGDEVRMQDNVSPEMVHESILEIVNVVLKQQNYQ